MDILSLTSLVIAVTVALGVLLKECGCLSSIKHFHGNCSRCCDIDLETKTSSPKGPSSGVFKSIDKLTHFLEEKKLQSDELISTFKRRMSEGDIPKIEIPNIDLPKIELQVLNKI